MQLELGEPRQRRISLTPLIDVVFLLLMFFILTSSFVQWRQIDLYAAEDKAPATPSKHKDQTWIFVTVNQCSDQKSDGIKVNGTQISTDALEKLLRNTVRQTGSHKVQLSLNEGTPLSCMVAVLDRIQSAGINTTTINGLVQ